MAFALITGASKGIGKAIAEELAKKKIDLLLVARSEDLLREHSQTLQQKYGIKTHYLATDLSTADSPSRVTNWIKQNQFQIYILVNNAGFGMYGKFEKIPLAEHKQVMQINMQTVVELTHELLPLLKKNLHAYILNVASTAAYQAVAITSTYAAGKAFVLSFTRALRYELKKSNVSVSCLCPGPTDTNFIVQAGMLALKKTAEKFNMKAETVAGIAVRGMFNGKAEIIPGFVNKLGVRLAYLMPKWAVEKFAANIYEKHLKE